MFKRIINFLFFFFPLLKFKVKEKSMEPKVKEGDIVFVNKFSYLFRDPKIGDIIAVKRADKKYIIKYIKEKKGKIFFILGYNLKESKDSRSFGWIRKKDIIGKIINDF